MSAYVIDYLIHKHSKYSESRNESCLAHLELDYYRLDKENSKKGAEGYVIFKRRDDYWAANHPRNIGQNNFDKITN